MNRLLPFLLVWLSAGAQAQVETLSLDQALELGLKNAFSVRIAEINRAKAQDLVLQARSATGVQIVLTGQYLRFDKPFSSGGPGSSHIDSKTVTGSASLPIDVSGSIRLAVEIAKLNAEASVANLRAEFVSTKEVIKQAYYGVVRADWLRTVAVESVENAKARLRNTKLRYDQGLLAKFDVLRVESELSRAEYDLINATNTVKQAKFTLNNAIARPIQTDFVTEDPDVTFPVLNDADFYANQANLERAEPMAQRYRVSILDRQVKLEGKGLAPTLTVGVQNQFTIDAPNGTRSSQATGNATVRWPLYDGGITKARVSAAKKDRDIAQIQLDQLNLTIGLQVRNAAIQYQNALELLVVSKNLVTAERENLRVAQLRFDEGTGILIDVTVAQENLTRALSNFANAKYGALSSLAALERAVGVDKLQTKNSTEESK